MEKEREWKDRQEEDNEGMIKGKEIMDNEVKKGLKINWSGKDG